MIKNIVLFSRTSKKFILCLTDSFLVILALFLSFSLRLGEWYIPSDNIRYIFLIAPFLALIIFSIFGLYHKLIRYLKIETFFSDIKTITIYSFLLGLLIYMSYLDYVPRSVIFLNWIITIILIIGSRLTAKSFLTDKFLNEQKKNIAIYGAGSAGRQLFSALSESDKFTPIAFFDDDLDISYHDLFGVKVYPRQDVDKVIEQKNIKEVYIAIPSISPDKKRKIVNHLEKFNIGVKTLPSFSTIADGNISLNDLKDISIDDILGRKRITPIVELLSKNIKNKVVLITGAGGSIGSELARQALRRDAKKIILYEHNESSLYAIDKELNDSRIIPLIGSIHDKKRFATALKKYKVKTVYHAAAYKHVPLVELNGFEGIKNNFYGTINCVDCSIEEKIETFVYISTDKAVRPTNLMGASKRISEMYIHHASKSAATNFSIVRFGNVLGSSGSVIPLFKEQINNGGPITLTHKNIIRYFMTISEAVELVIQAGAMGENGEIFLLDMGKPVLIEDLAKKMISLSGLKVKDKNNPDGDIEIKVIGLRPGEKLYEELLVDNCAIKTIHPKIMQSQEKIMGIEDYEKLIIDLKASINSNNSSKLKEILSLLIPGLSLSKVDNDLLK